MYLFLLAVIYLAFISLGLPDSLLGAAWPTIRTAFEVPLSYMGLISMIISGGTILSSLMSERLTKKSKPKRSLSSVFFLPRVPYMVFLHLQHFIRCVCGQSPMD